MREMDLAFYEKFSVPPPKKTPDERLQQRLAFRNERTLFKRDCSLTGKGIVSIYHPKSPYVVYNAADWWSDRWDGATYGRDFDFNRPFFEQFDELALQVPRISLFNVNPYNSDYCQQAYDNKNCYLCFVLKDCEDSMYLSHSNRLTDCFDCSHMMDSELCWECLDSEKLYGCVGAQTCQNSSDLYFCYDCIGCQNCIGCMGLRNKQYYIANEKRTKAEYEETLAGMRLQHRPSYQKVRNQFATFLQQGVHRENQNINVENSTGNYLLNAKNCYECFDSFEIEDCAYSTWIFESKDCQDIYGMGTSELVYSSVGVENLNFGAFNTFVSDSNDAFYSDLCFYSSDLFGCVGMRKKQYCILNKEYSADAYRDLRSKIVDHMQRTGEWGEFFPVQLSPFGYNETAATRYFPLSKDNALSMGYGWRDPEEKDYQPASALLPDDSKTAGKDITSAVFACASTGKNYRIHPQELAFYQKMSLPIPDECPDERYLRRDARRNPRKLYERTCAKSGKTIISPFSPDRPETVVCEEEYRKLVD